MYRIRSAFRSSSHSSSSLSKYSPSISDDSGAGVKVIERSSTNSSVDSSNASSSLDINNAADSQDVDSDSVADEVTSTENSADISDSDSESDCDEPLDTYEFDDESKRCNDRLSVPSFTTYERLNDHHSDSSSSAHPRKLRHWPAKLIDSCCRNSKTGSLSTRFRNRSLNFRLSRDHFNSLKLTGHNQQKRLQKELSVLVGDLPVGVSMDDDSMSQLQRWCFDVDGPSDSIYVGEKFRLQFKFGSRYPFEPPEVTFITPPEAPEHPHVYSNGHICLSVLADDWSPALTVHALILSIISMLSSSKEKKRPPDNAAYVRNCPENPQRTRWWFHDDTV